MLIIDYINELYTTIKYGVGFLC